MVLFAVPFAMAENVTRNARSSPGTSVPAPVRSFQFARIGVTLFGLMDADWNCKRLSRNRSPAGSVLIVVVPVLTIVMSKTIGWENRAGRLELKCLSTL